MKNLLLLLFLSCFIVSCDKDPNEGTDPTPTDPELFRMEDIPEITLEFSLADWNALLSNYDLNPKNEKKVVANFDFKLDGNTISLDSIGLKLRGNTSRRRPEGDTGQAHNATAPDWHHCHFGLDFAKNRDAQRFVGLEKLNLKWFKDDADYVREVYCYDLFERYGIWTAPQASYCRLTIKVEGDAAPAYYGVYAMVESVDEDFIAKRAEHWNASPGYLWKCGYGDGGAADFVSTNSMGVEDVKI